MADKWFGKGCEYQCCLWEDTEITGGSNYKMAHPVLIFCNHPMNTNDCEGNCTRDLCPSDNEKYNLPCPYNSEKLCVQMPMDDEKDTTNCVYCLNYKKIDCEKAIKVSVRDSDKIAFLLEESLDTLVEVGNGDLTEFLHEAAEYLFVVRRILFGVHCDKKAEDFAEKAYVNHQCYLDKKADCEKDTDLKAFLNRLFPEYVLAPMQQKLFDGFMDGKVTHISMPMQKGKPYIIRALRKDGNKR